ncbi:MAG: DUF393 domain-containing protein [Caulobacteraceae bacterium]|nr:DUF393 domain-containing protein [Caulobacteraceae bacterium]
MTETRPEPTKVTAWYDGACPLCRREIGLLRACDREGAIDLVDVAEGDSSDAPRPREDLLARFHARDRQGRLVSGAEAFLVVWGATPGLRWLEGLRRIRPLVLVLEGAYRIFLHLRPRLQSLARHVER